MERKVWGDVKALFVGTIFLGAGLLFAVQPMMAKMILPWFGGGAAVWATCLVFFQVVLLAGYAYANWVTRRFSGRGQMWIHAAVLAASLLVLPVLPAAAWKPAGAENPAWRIVLLLGATVGLPFFVLASTAPLVQAWYATRARVRGESGTPYWLYAVSNAGSMLGLASYPFLVEPRFATREQGMGWSAAYGIFTVLCAAVASLSRRSERAVEERVSWFAPTWREKWEWVALGASASMLLVAVTNHLSQNVAAMPLLWVAPLGLYLLSFILCFAGAVWYPRWVMLRLFVLALGAMAYALGPDFLNAKLLLLIPLFLAGLFICCMVCHGELARRKPHAAHLTSFYLMVAAGGALGGMFAGVGAPVIFDGPYELPTALAVCAVTVLVVLRRDPLSELHGGTWKPTWLVSVGVVLALVVSLAWEVHIEATDARVRMRNFYGSLRVIDEDAEDPRWARRKLLHGTIEHGLQRLAAEERKKATTYFAPESGAGLAIEEAKERGPVRVGVVGLGAGTLAAYGRKGDRYTFYEINPQVERVARGEFTFLADCEAEVEVVTGDARLAMEREEASGYDVLAVDAFSGDAIPAHLLTREAFEIYFRHLKPGGVLALHISNRYVDLEPVVQKAVEALGKYAVVVENRRDPTRSVYLSVWVLVSERADFFLSERIRSEGAELQKRDGLRMWTDDYSNVAEVVKWRR